MRKFQFNLFGNRAARHTFILLVIGLLLIISASLSVFGMYLLYGRHPVSARQMQSDTIRIITLMRTLPIAELPQSVRNFTQHGIRVRMRTEPDPENQIMTLADPASISKYIDQHSYDFAISVQLANGQWLNVYGHRQHSEWIAFGALLSGLALFLALVMLCVWAIKRLAWPWDAFTKAARRFGVDSEAPPMAIAGPREVQVVIKAFNEMQLRLRRLLNDRTQMLAAISHDLRTPITRLQLRAENLEGTDQYEKTVADLNEMDRMIASILSFARDNASKEPMELFDIAALLETLCDDMQDVGQDINFQSQAVGRIPYFGRMMAIKRSLSNLLENAVKYGEKAQVQLKKEDQGDLQIVIEDEGPGIPDEHMENVFLPFYRVDISRSLKKSGTGLGMTTARDIIRAHGGDIKLYNRYGRGLRVIVHLPCREM